MYITIHGTPEEIAGLVLALQDRRGVEDLASKVQAAMEERISRLQS